jgi:hypothetical protein
MKKLLIPGCRNFEIYFDHAYKQITKSEIPKSEISIPILPAARV